MTHYNLRLYFVTDGDYGFDLIPPGTKFDGEDYYLRKTFDSFANLRDYLNQTIPGFLNNIRGRKGDVERVKEKLSKLLDHVNGENAEDSYYDCIYGNQEGTEFSYDCEKHWVEFYVDFNDDEYKEFQESLISSEDVKKAILNCIKSNKREE